MSRFILRHKDVNDADAVRKVQQNMDESIRNIRTIKESIETLLEMFPGFL